MSTRTKEWGFNTYDKEGNCRDCEGGFDSRQSATSLAATSLHKYPGGYAEVYEQVQTIKGVLTLQPTVKDR